MKKRYLFAVVMLLSMLSAKAEGTYFTYDASKYHQETVIYVAFKNAEGNREDHHGYLGAFINGECRYEATPKLDTSVPGDVKVYYEVRVGGDAATENGSTITFRFCEQQMTGGPGNEYELSATETFVGDNTKYEASNPLLIEFIPVTSIALPGSITVNRGQTVNLIEKITKTPANGTLPRLTWSVSPGSDTYFTIDGNNLTAKKVTLEQEPCTLTVSDQVQELATNTQVIVNSPATSFTWTSAYEGGKLTVPVGDNTAIDAALAGGFTLTPDDATTTFMWTSDNTAVVDQDNAGAWEAKAVGTVTLTGTPRPDDGSTVSPKLTVTVVQPVTAVNLKNVFLLAEVGEDITARLSAIASAYPTTASNPSLTWDFSPTAGSLGDVVKDANGHFIASASTGKQETITFTAKDGYGANSNIVVYVLPKQPTSIAAKQNPLYLTKPATENPNITNDLKGNVTVSPADVDATNQDALISTIFTNLRTSFGASNDANVQTALACLDNDLKSYISNAQTFSFSGHEGKLSIGDDGNGSPVYTLTASGTFTATVAITHANLNALDDPSLLASGGAAANAALRTELTAPFSVQVVDGLASFAVPAIVMTAGGTAKLVIKEQPVSAEFDKTKIVIRIETANALPAGWTYATATADASDATGCTFDISAKSIGKGTIYVDYDKQKGFGSGTIDVRQSVTVADGWQWVALQQGSIDTKPDLQTALGNSLAEVRSKTQLMINDSQYGYYGELTTLAAGQTYKVRMKDGSAGKQFDVANTDEYMQNVGTEKSLATVKGWNWVGNPYQYYQKLSDVFGNTTFTENDIVKGKNAFATFSGGQWKGELEYLAPGEGVLINTQNPVTLYFAGEGSMSQNTAKPASARVVGNEPAPWKVDGSRFDDNMAMVAQIYGVDDPSRVTLWAFVGDECRGRGVAINDRQFITVHGNMGEKVTFRLYDALTQKFHEVYGGRTLTSTLGTFTAPVPLHAGQVVTAIDAVTTGQPAAVSCYDLQGRRVTAPTKGIYVNEGKKIVIK